MAVAFVQTVGSAAPTTTGTTISVTVPAAGCGVGNLLLFAWVAPVGTSTNPPTITDTGGNTWHMGASDTLPDGADLFYGTGLTWEVTVAYSILTTGLVSGNTIAVATASTTKRCGVILEFTGVASVSPFDKAKGASTSTTSGTAADSGLTASTTVSNDAVVGFVSANGPTTDAANTVGDMGTGNSANVTLLTRIGTSGGGATSNFVITPEYTIPIATGTFRANMTLGTARAWSAVVLCMKGQTTVITSVIPNVNMAPQRG